MNRPRATRSGPTWRSCVEVLRGVERAEAPGSQESRDEVAHPASLTTTGASNAGTLSLGAEGVPDRVRSESRLLSRFMGNS